MGRRTRKEEMKMMSIINRSWSFLGECLNSDDVTQDQKIDIAKHIAGKSVPKQLMITQSIPPSINIITANAQEIMETAQVIELQPAELQKKITV